MRKPTRTWLLSIAAVLVVLALILILRTNIPPHAARLLPECDAIVYANLKPLRAATHFDRTPLARSPDFQRFIDATGIVPERDLDDAAFALHRRDDPTGPNGPVAYTEVFEGRFDTPSLARYLATIAAAQETYANHDIYIIPVGDTPNTRRLRVTLLDAHTVAASNAPTPEQIHAILDRNRSFASPFAGPTLLSALYPEVPALSSAWAIGSLGLPFAESGFVDLFGLRLPLPADTPFVASLRYLGSVRLRVEEIATSDADAQKTAQALASILTLFQSVALHKTNNTAATAQDTAMRQMLGSLKIESRKERVVLTANIPLYLLRQLSAPDNSDNPTPPASH